MAKDQCRKCRERCHWASECPLNKSKLKKEDNEKSVANSAARSKRDEDSDYSLTLTSQDRFQVSLIGSWTSGDPMTYVPREIGFYLPKFEFRCCFDRKRSCLSHRRNRHHPS